MKFKDKKKRVLFVMGFPCPFPGAGWWRIFYFARHFSKKGHLCLVLSSLSPNTIIAPKVVKNDKIYIYNLLPYANSDNPFVLFLNNISALLAFIPVFLTIRPNIAIVSVPPFDQLLSIFLLSRIARRKVIIDYRDEFEDYVIMHTRRWGLFYRLVKRFLAALYRHASMITTVTPALAKDLKRRGISNIRVIYDGVDTKIFQPLNKSEMRSEFQIPQNSFVVAYLGHAYNPYRVDIIIRALKKLNKKDSQHKYLLVLIGGGAENILNLASNLGISDLVRYFGVVNNPTEIARILSTADCGIIPYDDNPLWQKTYSTKLFEYSAIGLPIIATVHENSVLANLIKANRMGLIVPPANSDSLSSSIEKLATNEVSRINLSSSALHFARMHEKDKCADELLGIVEGLL